MRVSERISFFPQPLSPDRRPVVLIEFARRRRCVTRVRETGMSASRCQTLFLVFDRLVRGAKTRRIARPCHSRFRNQGPVSPPDFPLRLHIPPLLARFVQGVTKGVRYPKNKRIGVLNRSRYLPKIEQHVWSLLSRGPPVPFNANNAKRLVCSVFCSKRYLTPLFKTVSDPVVRHSGRPRALPTDERARLGL
jgi:hypothetical protein